MRGGGIVAGPAALAHRNCPAGGREAGIRGAISAGSGAGRPCLGCIFLNIPES